MDIPTDSILDFGEETKVQAEEPAPTTSKKLPAAPLVNPLLPKDLYSIQGSNDERSQNKLSSAAKIDSKHVCISELPSEWNMSSHNPFLFSNLTSLNVSPAKPAAMLHGPAALAEDRGLANTQEKIKAIENQVQQRFKHMMESKDSRQQVYVSFCDTNEASNSKSGRVASHEASK